mgnify:FL=1
MNALFIRAKNSQDDFLWGLLEYGVTIQELNTPEFDPNEIHSEEISALSDALDVGNYDCVISFLFLPEVSNLCLEKGVEYISWTYDSPLVSYYSDALGNPNNHTFVFDYTEAEELKARGGANIHHLPLACNLSRVGGLEITPEDETTFSHDISYVGNFYSDNSYNKFFPFLADDIADELRREVESRMFAWNAPRDWPILSPKLTEALAKLGTYPCRNMDLATFIGITFVCRKLAEIERVSMVHTLANYFSVDVYTRDGSEFLQAGNIHSSVNYYTDMSKIFYLSKINLNLTLPSIRSAVPQRVFDVLGCGGFLLTNEQPELCELFCVGEEIETFHSLEELVAKIKFYQAHEDLRLRIAMKGYQAIRERHTYQHRIAKMQQFLREDGLR